MSAPADATEPGVSRKEADAKVVLALAEYYRLRAAGAQKFSVGAMANLFNCNKSTLNR
jgi:hypothetical protein